jgi:hypothetical protein
MSVTTTILIAGGIAVGVGIVYLIIQLNKKVAARIRGIEVTNGREICFDDVAQENYLSDEKTMKWKIKGLNRIIDQCPTKYQHTNRAGQIVAYLVKDNDELKWVDLGNYQIIVDSLSKKDEAAHLDHIPVSNSSRQAIVHQIRIANTRKQTTFMDFLNAAAPYIMMVIIILGAAITWNSTGKYMKEISAEQAATAQTYERSVKINQDMFDIMVDYIDEKQKLRLDTALNATRAPQ